MGRQGTIAGLKINFYFAARARVKQLFQLISVNKGSGESFSWVEPNWAILKSDTKK